MTVITITDDVCWVCGEKFSSDKEMEKTTHHTLPTNLKPKKNILVPVHQKCHNKINEVDMASMIQFLYRLQKESNKLNMKVNALAGFLQSNTVKTVIKNLEKK